ncbi:hypothetical protein FRC02_005956 [Tulasnella sp. 418]|nr:hypothetical protein FRC02_005956 [Tulasnella sp. 418]
MQRRFGQTCDNINENESSSFVDELLQSINLEAWTSIYLSDVQKKIAHAKSHKPKADLSLCVRASLLPDLTAVWRDPIQDCCTAVRRVLESHLARLVSEHFGKMPKLKDAINRAMGDRIKRVESTTREALKLILELEDDPYTQNTHDLKHFKQFWLERYKKARADVEQNSTQPVQVSDDSSNRCPATSPHYHSYLPLTPSPSPTRINPHGGQLRPIDDINPEVTGNTRPKKPLASTYEEELSVMADARAYFQLTSMHFVDTVPKIINRCLLKEAVSNLQEYLLHSLGSGVMETPGRLEALLRVGDATLIKERDSLKQKQKVLDAALKEIIKFKRLTAVERTVHVNGRYHSAQGTGVTCRSE